MKTSASNSATRLSIALLFVSCGIVMLSRSYLFYEGSESFIFPAEYAFEAPMYAKPLRWARVLLNAPLLTLRYLTENLDSLSVAYGLPFALVPPLAVLFVLHRFRSLPQAASVALIGMCLAPLPWQLFSVSPWAVVNQLSWVLVACVACARESRALRAATVVVVAVLFFTHALSIVTFLSVGAALLVVAHFRPEERGSDAEIGIAFFLLGSFRLALVFFDGSEKRRFGDLMGISQNELTDGFHHVGAGFVGVYFLLLLASAAVLLTRHPRRFWLGAGLQAVAATELAGYFVVNPRPWLFGIDYHLWTFALLPALIVACLLSARITTVNAVAPAYAGIPAARFVPALVFLMWVTAGSVDFRREMSRMDAAVASAPNACLEVIDLPGEFSGYPAFGFVFSTNYLATGAVRRPPKVLLSRPCREVCWRASPDEQHLFDFGVLSRGASDQCATTMRDVLE